MKDALFPLERTYDITIQWRAAQVYVNHRIGKLAEPMVTVFNLTSRIERIAVLEENRGVASIRWFWTPDQRVAVFTGNGLDEDDAAIRIVVKPMFLSFNFGGVHPSTNVGGVIFMQRSGQHIKRVSVNVDYDGFTDYFVLKDTSEQIDSRIVLWCN